MHTGHGQGHRGLPRHGQDRGLLHRRPVGRRWHAGLPHHPHLRAHRRPAAVVTKNASGKIILASTYAYGQYDNLTRETSLSQLDLTDTSNYQITYGYDGLLRLISAVREDLDGNLIRSLSYEYDAASNLTKKVEVTPGRDA